MFQIQMAGNVSLYTKLNMRCRFLAASATTTVTSQQEDITATSKTFTSTRNSKEFDYAFKRKTSSY